MTVDEIMALAGVLATKRVLRFRAHLVTGGRTAGRYEQDQAEAAVTRATDALRAAVETLCQEPSNEPSTPSQS